MVTNAKDNTQPLLSYAIIENENDSGIVELLLEEINSSFFIFYTLHDIFTKKSAYFKEFQSWVKDMLKDPQDSDYGTITPFPFIPPDSSSSIGCAKPKYNME